MSQILERHIFASLAGIDAVGVFCCCAVLRCCNPRFVGTMGKAHNIQVAAVGSLALPFLGSSPETTGTRNYYVQVPVRVCTL